MTEYSRGAFCEWLESLPQDKPFCDDNKCPIATWLRTDNCRAYYEDSDLAKAIDDHTPWSELTPKQIITIINRLEAGDYERIDDDDLPF